MRVKDVHLNWGISRQPWTKSILRFDVGILIAPPPVNRSMVKKLETDFPVVPTLGFEFEIFL